MRKEMLLIINPAAGKGKGAAIGRQAEELYTQNGWHCTVQETRDAGDATRFVREHDRVQMVTCVGGDGTLSETLGGLVDMPEQPALCYIPMGSTNDMALSVGLPKKPLLAAQCALDGHPQEIDAGRLDDRVFSYVACFGAFSRTSYITGRQMKNRLGHFAYILTGARELNNIRPFPVQVDCEGERITGNFLFGAVCNTRSLGGALKLPVDEDALHDGTHEMLLVRDPKNIFQALSLLWSLARGQYDHPLMVVRRIREAYFYMPADMPWSLDGERADTGRVVHVCNLPNAYRMMLPKK